MINNYNQEDIGLLIDTKISKNEKTKVEDKKFKYKLIASLTLAISLVNFFVFNNSYLDEKISLHNTPTFPLYNLTLYLNFSFPNEKIDIIFFVWEEFRNGSHSTPKKVPWRCSENYCYSYSELFFGINPIYLNEGDRLIIKANVDAINYQRLSRKYFSIGYLTYFVNTKNEIAKRFLSKHYFLDEELLLYNKINEGKIYNYKLESNTIENGGVTKNFASISEQEGLGFLPPEKYGPFFLSLIFEKGDILKITKVKKDSFYYIFYVYFGATGTLVSIILFMLKKKN